MKFYEFDTLVRYTIICAKNKHEAVEYYNNTSVMKLQKYDEVKRISKRLAIEILTNEVNKMLEKKANFTEKMYTTEKENEIAIDEFCGKGKPYTVV